MKLIEVHPDGSEMAKSRRMRIREQHRLSLESYPRSEADDFFVVNADDYTRACRDNLRQIHRLVVFQPDPLADELVFETVQSLNTLWLMKDICKAMNLSKARIFQACNRLIARGRLSDLNQYEKWLATQVKEDRPDIIVPCHGVGSDRIEHRVTGIVLGTVP